MTVVVKLVLDFDRSDHCLPSLRAFPFSFLSIATSQVISCIERTPCFRSDLLYPSFSNLDLAGSLLTYLQNCFIKVEVAKMFLSNNLNPPSLLHIDGKLLNLEVFKCSFGQRCPTHWQLATHIKYTHILDLIFCLMPVFCVFFQLWPQNEISLWSLFLVPVDHPTIVPVDQPEATISFQWIN